MLAFKICMNFNFVIQNNPVSFSRIFITIYRCSNSIINRANLNNLHTCKNRYAHCLFRYSVTIYNFKISFYSTTAMASHSRHNKWLRSPFLQLVANSTNNFRIMRYTATANRYRNSFSFSICSHFRLFQLLL